MVSDKLGAIQFGRNDMFHAPPQRDLVHSFHLAHSHHSGRGRLVCHAIGFAGKMIGNLLEAFISFSERFERMLVTPGKRRRVVSTKTL